jgi:hypothetical protein
MVKVIAPLPAAESRFGYGRPARFAAGGHQTTFITRRGVEPKQARAKQLRIERAAMEKVRMAAGPSQGEIDRDDKTLLVSIGSSLRSVRRCALCHRAGR